MKTSKIKPILFNSQMVRAILDGKKTETRRIIKPQPIMPLCYIFAGSSSDVGKWHYPDKNAWEIWGEKYKRPDNFSKKDERRVWKAPYNTDDILYVRETWAPLYKDETSDEVVGYMYKEQTLEEYDRMYSDGKDYYWAGKWKPSIHMPKEAARIFLKVTNVRVERLQDITVQGAINEGMPSPACREGDAKCLEKQTLLTDCPSEFIDHSFQKVWDATISYPNKEIYGWDANPFVWVVEFERCSKPTKI